jgi:hypothetical protein
VSGDESEDSTEYFNMTAHIIMSKYNNKRAFAEVSNPWGAKKIGHQKGTLSLCIYVYIYMYIYTYV